jgi:class 3 adenylate cyclase/preprotein translocase subunit SecG
MPLKLRIIYALRNSGTSRMKMLSTKASVDLGCHSDMLQVEHILLRVCQALIVVIVLQSLKLTSPFLFKSVQPYPIDVSLHITNMCTHLLVFIQVLILLKKKAIKRAKLLLIFGFSSYILIACWLWKYEVNLQYYFLLSMFISCYVFDRHKSRQLFFVISLQLVLFILMQQQTSIDMLNSQLPFKDAKISYLKNIAHINALVFALSCLICALFIRSILAKNWQQLKYYEATQSQLLKRLFPPELVPPLLSVFEKNLNNKGQQFSFDELNKVDLDDMQASFNMGVVFLDIVDFTRLTSKHCVKPLHWKSIYNLFSEYDEAISAFDVKRIKTNGDQYILLLGFKSQDKTPTKVALQLLEVCRALQQVSAIKVKIGAAFGPVTCGVFDPNNPNFDIWGETVIRAARLEKLAKPNQVLIDQSTFEHTSHFVDFSEPVQHSLKGLGEQLVYTLPSK